MHVFIGHNEQTKAEEAALAQLTTTDTRPICLDLVMSATQTHCDSVPEHNPIQYGKSRAELRQGFARYFFGANTHGHGPAHGTQTTSTTRRPRAIHISCDNNNQQPTNLRPADNMIIVPCGEERADGPRVLVDRPLELHRYGKVFEADEPHI